MVYTVQNMFDDLTDHEINRVIKIKLADGTVKDIEGVQFKNIICNGDDVIYIKELNPLKQAWGKGIIDFVRFADKIMETCEFEYEKILEDENADPCDILNIENEIAKTADFYIEKCNLQKCVEERYGYYEKGAGDTDEVYAKIDVLKNFMNI